jgi:S-adenosylmethionine hydrolase
MSEIPNKLDIYPGQVEYIINTQFRSFEFLPRVAKWIWEKIELPVENMMIDEVEDIEGQIWWVDNFGNCKTTFLPEEIGFEVGKEIQFKNLPAVKCYAKLKDVPNGDPALVVGSSGIEGKRFVEFLVQGSSAANNYGLKVGDLL